MKICDEQGVARDRGWTNLGLIRQPAFDQGGIVERVVNMCDLPTGIIERHISVTGLAGSSVPRRFDGTKIRYEALNDARRRALVEILIGKVEHDSRINWTLEYLLVLDRKLIYPTSEIT